jgi:hypothetical protein
MWRVAIAVALFWLVVLPPFFTKGACTAEFDAVARQIQDHRSELTESASAQAYWRSVNVPVHVLTPVQCRTSRPRFIDSCVPGVLLYLDVPIQNQICRVYRDSSVRVQFQYDDHDRLRQFQADMKPFKVLSLPWLGINWYWAR